MLVVMNTNATEQDINRVIYFVESRGFEARLCRGETKSVVAAVGKKEIDKRDIELLSGVHEVIKLTTSYNRFYTENIILKEQDEEKRESWLYLTELVYNVNKILLNILAIDIPERM